MDDIKKEIIKKAANHLINLIQNEVNNNEREINGIAIILNPNNEYEIKILASDKDA